MNYQIEITTRCNYACNYCAGRSMIQQDMDIDLYKSIITSIPINSHVTLQGEGEPTLHPHFREMCDIASHLNITTTVNGTILDNLYPFKILNISIDTLDPILANTIGRYNISKVLSNIEEFKKTSKSIIVIRTVDFGQDMTALNAYTKTNNFTWWKQPLITKVGYPNNNITMLTPRTFICSYRQHPKLKYFTVTGRELPCCFIKNDLSVPEACAGCTIL